MLHISTPYLIDTHAHINLKEYEDDLQSVLRSAKEENVRKIIVVGTEFTSNEQVIELIDSQDNLWGSIGFYPGYADEIYLTENNLVLIEKQLVHKRIVALGEVGLEYHYYKNTESQKRLFIEALDLAIKHELPLIIHCRDAFDDIFEILENYRGKIKGVFHCFTGGPAEAKKIVDFGFLIGITGIITFGKNEKLIEAIEQVSLDNILLETDCPHLSPVPFRGKRNEPKNISIIAKKVSEIRKVDYSTLARVTSLNAEKLFHLS